MTAPDQRPFTSRHRRWPRLALCGHLLLAAAGPAWAITGDSDKPIHISSRNAQLDRSSQTLVYQGNVRIDQGTLRVIADRMVVEYEADRVVRITATGSPARYQQELEGSQGHVHANARQIVYHTQAESLDLIGAAQLLQHGSELKGEVISYDIEAGRVAARSNDSGPVRMILQPSARQTH
ncbi:MAG: lipopolysaccharide transport periplasmic protein LptA [Pseudomonadales bacterium]